MLEHEEFYSANDVAVRLGLHVRTVRRFIREGRLEARRVGKQYRIPEAGLRALVGSRGQNEASSRRRRVLASTTVDVDEIDGAEQERFVALLMGAFPASHEAPTGRRIDAIYYQDQRRLRIVVHAGVGLTNAVLGMVGAILDDRKADR